MTASNYFTNDNTARIVGGAKGGATITPHDTNELVAVTRYINVSATGTVKVTLEDGSVVTLTLVTGYLHKVCAKIIWSVGTSAGTIVALW